VQRLAALVCEAARRSSCEAVRRSSCEAVRRSSCQAVRRSGYEAVRRSSCEAVRRSSCQAFPRSSCAVVVVVAHKAHLLTSPAHAEPRARRTRARGGAHKDYWTAYWRARSSYRPDATLDERNCIMPVIIHISGSTLSLCSGSPL
jgi:hypothetical protein